MLSAAASIGAAKVPRMDAEKTLSELAKVVDGARCSGEAALHGLEYDSRAVTPGALYIAVLGERFDGHAFLPEVLAKGAAAVVVERAETVPEGVPYLLVPSCRAALAPLACAFWDDPTQKLLLAGVTGTNGKTSTVRLIDAIARAAGDITGTIGTLGASVGDTALPHERTTPEAPDLQRLFAQMLQAGARSAVIEVASHALALGRTQGCRFDIAAFTNLTQDHLDYHKTMESYEAAKGMLFRDYHPGCAILNTDDALVVAPRVDATVMVVSEGVTRRESLVRAVGMLAEFSVAGIALNRASQSIGAEYYGY